MTKALAIANQIGAADTPRIESQRTLRGATGHDPYCEKQSYDSRCDCGGRWMRRENRRANTRQCAISANKAVLPQVNALLVLRMKVLRWISTALGQARAPQAASP